MADEDGAVVLPLADAEAAIAAAEGNDAHEVKAQAAIDTGTSERGGAQGEGLRGRLRVRAEAEA